LLSLDSVLSQSEKVATFKIAVQNFVPAISIIRNNHLLSGSMLIK